MILVWNISHLSLVSHHTIDENMLVINLAFFYLETNVYARFCSHKAAVVSKNM